MPHHECGRPRPPGPPLTRGVVNDDLSGSSSRLASARFDVDIENLGGKVVESPPKNLQLTCLTALSAPHLRSPSRRWFAGFSLSSPRGGRALEVVVTAPPGTLPSLVSVLDPPLARQVSCALSPGALPRRRMVLLRCTGPCS